ncbi:NADP-dependent oxidoreductase [Hymenobacter sp. BRD128]|uniref:NADP-dependent oxidoreductase n=1 Tax=Hymenobacter sp. BRD128 TaxID=2675878 RepID=UPI001567A295|nr:NADP-dependent oxidoreductase [Hymenobacter sp. BRD128]QKG56374.1 NADP-dependent oxidoreductase [Hymenobacter sp. BRD128]
MKAVRIHAFGGPEVLQIEDVARPVPAPDEILVKVYASGVNPVDWVIREGANEMMRSFLTLPLTLGWDAAGTVAEVGSAVTDWQPGDAVYGLPNFPGNGSYAEYCAAKASQFARKPQGLSFNEAAGVPLAGLTAWTGLFAHGKLQAGQRVLIQGASGGVGSFAVQFAKAKGAYVIGLASAGNLAYLKELGADEALDYRSQPFEDVVRDVDVVLEASPQRDNVERLKSVAVLKPGGIFVSVNVDAPFDETVLAALAQKQATGELAPNQPRHDWLAEIAQLIDAGQVKVFVSQVFPLAQVADAHRESQTWHVRGKLILEITKDDAPA